MNRLIKRVAIIGPESTGKTTLAKELASHYNTEWVPEYAREYLTTLGRKYTRHDLKDIAKGQLSLETQQEKRVESLLICDTNLIVLKVWSEHKYGELDQWIADQIESRKYDLYLLTACDVPWEMDSLRENRFDREDLFKQYEAFLKEKELPYVVLKGTHEERMKRSIEIINDL